MYFLSEKQEPESLFESLFQDMKLIYTQIGTSEELSGTVSSLFKTTDDAGAYEKTSFGSQVKQGILLFDALPILRFRRHLVRYTAGCKTRHTGIKKFRFSCTPSSHFGFSKVILKTRVKAADI
jgi:hypothetical protein